MASLKDVLTTLRRLDVGPEEIKISSDIYAYIIQKAEEIVAEEGEEDEEMRDTDRYLLG